MSYDMSSITSDCYDGTTCLINKFNIKNEQMLSKVEADITFAKIAELESRQINGNFNTEHYKSIHKFIFEDLYDWAGEFRKINISKKGTNFTEFNSLNNLCDNLFSRLIKISL